MSRNVVVSVEPPYKTMTMLVARIANGFRLMSMYLIKTFDNSS